MLSTLHTQETNAVQKKASTASTCFNRYMSELGHPHEVKKFEQVSSDGHQMAGEGIAQVPRGREQCIMGNGRPCGQADRHK